MSFLMPIIYYLLYIFPQDVPRDDDIQKLFFNENLRLFIA